jgi:hypothetical protein
LICGVPNLICALTLIFVIPESPKFTYSQGDEQKTLKIFRQIYTMNTGKPDDTFPVVAIIKNEDFGEGSKKSSEGFFKFMWFQTTPLFKGSHLRNILTACFIQFAVCNTLYGFFTFFPEISNKVTVWTQASNGPATICEVFHSNISNDGNVSLAKCTDKLELATFGYIYENFLLGFVGFVLITILINRVGKLNILGFIFVVAIVSAVLLICLRMPIVAMHLYVVMMLSGLSISVIIASTVELFPTKMRAMAVCISMMFGRSGSVVGSLVIGVVIESHCKETFIMPIVLIAASLALSFTIPNISKRIK